MPVIALMVGGNPIIEELGSIKNVEHLSRHVEECRNGDFSGFGCLRAALNLGLTTVEEVGTSSEEMQQFHESRCASDLATAKEVLAAARGGDFSRFKELYDLLGETVSGDELGLENEEFRKLTGGYNVYIAKVVVEECREGNFSSFDNLAKGWSSASYSLAEVGTTPEELAQFQRDRYIVPAKRYLEEAKAGNFENIDELTQLINSGKVGVDLEVTQEQLHQILKPHYVERAKAALTDREDDPDLVPKLLEMIDEGVVTYEELGITEEELKAIPRKASVQALREIADQCREGDFTNLPLLAMAMGLLPEELSAEEIESLDLDLDGWKHQDEINRGRELVEALRERGFSDLGDVDRQLLMRFNAEELGLTDEEWLIVTTPSAPAV
jgi:hypothetical protein